MKNMFRFCLIASLLSAAIARGVEITVYSPQNEEFKSDGVVSGSVIDTTPWCYADGSFVKAGERIRLVAVRCSPYSSQFSQEKQDVLNGKASVALDVNGTPVPVGFAPLTDPFEGVPVERTVIFGQSESTESNSASVVSGAISGAIGSSTGTFTVPPSLLESGEATIPNVAHSLWKVVPEGDDPSYAWWLFLIVEDTRCGDKWDPSTSLVAGAGCMVAPVLKDIDEAMGGNTPEPLMLSSMGPPPNRAYVEAGRIAYHEVSLPSRVTTENGEYTDSDDIEQLYTPVLSAFTQVEGGFKLSIAERGEGQYQSRLDGEVVPEGALYDIVTATSLKDASWESLDAVLEKKSLAPPAGMRYTRLQLNGLSDVFLPIMDDKTRFYKVQRSTMTQGEK